MATITLTIRNVPVDVAMRLSERADHNHRSLQSELLALVEAAARGLLLEDPTHPVKPTTRVQRDN